MKLGISPTFTATHSRRDEKGTSRYFVLAWQVPLLIHAQPPSGIHSHPSTTERWRGGSRRDLRGKGITYRKLFTQVIGFV
jgi:hypothetical protein